MINRTLFFIQDLVFVLPAFIVFCSKVPVSIKEWFNFFLEQQLDKNDNEGDRKGSNLRKKPGIKTI